jgi:hypothetical protein
MGFMTSVQFPAWTDIFLFTAVSRYALGPINPLVYWVLGTLSLEVKWWGVKLTTHILPMKRLRI